MPVVCGVERYIVKDESIFFNCKKCGVKGVYNKNKILCNACFLKLKEDFK